MKIQDIGEIVPKSLTIKIQRNIRSTGSNLKAEVVLGYAIIITSILSIFLTSFLIVVLASKLNIIILIILTILFLLVSLIIFSLLSYMSILAYTNVKKYQRKKAVELVLSDYLQLVAANVGSGMTIDQSLWYAVRSRFGILAKEIEEVAKKVMGGTELEEALGEFAEKYDSELLKSSIQLLIEGLESGGELAQLINKIAWHVKETQIMRKEISSNVAAYSMFIRFSTLVAAPFLFSLAYQLIIMMTTILGRIHLPETVTTTGFLPIGGEIGVGITSTTFLIFAIVCLIITSAFAAIIVTTVQKGSVKAGFRSIPIYIIISLGLFWLISKVLSSFLSRFL